jgi:hypothetical protein
MSGILITYDDGTRMDDVNELILMLTPKETPLLSGMKKTKASQTWHEWLEETHNVGADNAVPEGATFGTADQTVASRVGNTVQIFEKVFEVSSTEQWVKKYGTDNMFMHQKEKAMIETGLDAELTILRGSRASGNNAGASARRLAGLYNFITTLASTVASGTKLTESLFNDALEAMVNQDNGAEVMRELECYVGSRLKRVISAYTAGSTKNVNSADKRLTNVTDVYESDYGIVKIFYHRYALSTTNSNATALFVDMSRLAIAIGEEIHQLSDAEVAQTKHGKMGVIRGELTLEVRGERHMNQLVGLDTSFN